MYTVKEEKKIFLKNEEIQKGSGAKSYMTEGFLIYEDLAIYEEAVIHIWLCTRSLLKFLINEGNFLFFF